MSDQFQMDEIDKLAALFCDRGFPAREAQRLTPRPPTVRWLANLDPVLNPLGRVIRSICGNIAILTAVEGPSPSARN